MRIVWVVAVKMSKTWILSRCLFEHVESAFYDWKSHVGMFRIIYPKLITEAAWRNIPEHNGW